MFYIKLFIEYAEAAIDLIKKRLYATLRSKLSKDWITYLKPTVDNINERHVKSLGGFQPKNANSFFDDVKIRNAQKQKGIVPYKDRPLEKQLENQKQFNENAKKSFAVGDFVYLDAKTSAFDKSYDMKISIFN